MDGREGGGGSYVMLGSAPLGPSFLVSPSVKLSVAGCGEAGKGGSCMLIPDLVVMARVGASSLGVLLLLIAERIWEYYSCNSLRLRILEKKLIGLRLLVKNQKSIYSREVRCERVWQSLDELAGRDGRIGGEILDIRGLEYCAQGRRRRDCLGHHSICCVSWLFVFLGLIDYEEIIYHLFGVEVEFHRKQISDKRMKNQAKMDKIKQGMERR
ncbi:hypothetical protein Tco_0194533 [Tanacetum coccineum]